MKKIMLLILMLILFSIKTFSSELWNTYSQDYFIDDKKIISLVEEFRFESDTLNTYVQYVGMKYSITKTTKAALWYKFISSRHRYHFDNSQRVVGDISFNLHGIYNRSRIESGISKDLLLYRNKTKLSFPKVFGLTPFVSEELFFDLSGDNLIENRLCAGISIDYMSISYMNRRKRKSYGWDASDIVVISFKIKF